MADKGKGKGASKAAPKPEVAKAAEKATPKAELAHGEDGKFVADDPSTPENEHAPTETKVEAPEKAEKVDEPKEAKKAEPKKNKYTSVDPPKAEKVDEPEKVEEAKAAIPAAVKAAHRPVASGRVRRKVKLRALVDDRIRYGTSLYILKRGEPVEVIEEVATILRDSGRAV